MPGFVSARRWVPHRGAGSIPVHSICSYVFTSLVLFVDLELDLGLWLIFLYYLFPIRMIFELFKWRSCERKINELSHLSAITATLEQIRDTRSHTLFVLHVHSLHIMSFRLIVRMRKHLNLIPLLIAK